MGKPFKKTISATMHKLKPIFVLWGDFISKKNIRIQNQTKNNLPDKRMQKPYYERNLLQ